MWVDRRKRLNFTRLKRQSQVKLLDDGRAAAAVPADQGDSGQGSQAPDAGLVAGVGAGEAGSPARRRPSVADAPPVPDWLPESQLEHAAPNAVALLTRVWGTAAATKALRALIFDSAGVARRWSPAALSELGLLCAVHGHRNHACACVLPDLSLLQRIHDRVHGRLPDGMEPWRDFFLAQ